MFERIRNAKDETLKKGVQRFARVGLGVLLVSLAGFGAAEAAESVGAMNHEDARTVEDVSGYFFDASILSLGVALHLQVERRRRAQDSTEMTILNVHQPYLEPDSHREHKVIEGDFEVKDILEQEGHSSEA